MIKFKKNIIRINIGRIGFLYFVKNVELFPIVNFDSKYPLVLRSSFFKIFPLLSVITEIPEFADLIKGTPFSTDLKIDAVKCCWGPVELPNHASLVILTNRSIFSELKV